jgi:uncharacterized repeat protein (TIGR03803 family)
MKQLFSIAGSAGRLTTLRIRQNRSSELACLITVLFLTASAHSQANPGTYEVLHAFTNSPDGGYPVSGLLRDTQGNLYGTTSAGGNTSASCNNNYCGVVFKIDSAGNETALYSFNGQPDGANPLAGLVEDAAGNLYGTTCGGGATGNGTIFKVDSSGKETVLYSFAGQPDGSCPGAGLVLDAAGNLYGTTTNGGVSNAGAIFKLDTTGKETVVYSFTGQADGKSPQDLLRDSAGNLYGTANRGGVVNCTGPRGGTIGCGTIFKLDTTETFTVLYSFQGWNPTRDGGLPVGALVADAAGNLYGATEYGGSGGCVVGSPGGKTTTVGCGTVFKIDPTGAETVLHSFTGPDGSLPRAGLTIDASGDLYGIGTTAPNTFSDIFELDTSGNLRVLYQFSGAADGDVPMAPLLRDSAGNLYGTTSRGGNTNCSSGCGVVFELPATSSPVFNVVITMSGGGTGTVTSSPSGIICPTDCVSAFPAGTAVTLTATSTGGSTFTGWSNNCSTTSNNLCTVDSTQVLSAGFNPPPPDFTISASAFTPTTVNPGSSAISTISTTASGGFNGSITLSCTVQSSVAFAPTCSVSPTTVNAGTSSKVTVNTTGPSAAVVTPFDSGILYVICLPVLGLMVAGPTLIGRNRMLRVRLGLLCLLAAGALFQLACGGSKKIVSGGTPAGSYTVIVTGVSGSLEHSVNPNPTLSVQ